MLLVGSMPISNQVAPDLPSLSTYVRLPLKLINIIAFSLASIKHRSVLGQLASITTAIEELLAFNFSQVIHLHFEAFPLICTRDPLE